MNDRFPKRPKSIKLKEFNNHITILIRWFDRTALYFTAITLFWCVFSLLAFIDVFNNLSDLLIFRKAVLLIVFSTISIFLIYSTIALLVNQTVIFVNQTGINVYHKPIPCPTRRQKEPIFRVSNLEELYLKQKFTKRQGSGTSKDFVYEIRIKNHNGSDRKLVWVPHNEEALFIEKILKDYLNLEDEPQESELGSET